MKCPKCGRELKTGQLYCENCGQEIQIVPDYDPLDELLIGQVDSENKTPDAKRHDGTMSGGSVVKDGKEKHVELSGSREGRKKGEALPAPEKKRFRFRKRWVLVPAALFMCVAVFCLSYLWTTRENSYSYQLRRGKSLTESGNYEEAVSYLEKAQALQADTEGTDTEPLEYLARAYAHTGEEKLAADCMESAIRAEDDARGESGTLLELYLEYMEILNLTGQTEQIAEVIEGCPYADIQTELFPYRIEKPVCDVPEGTYSYYLRLELSAEYGTIYYTLDGTKPTEESTSYERPIELHEEGEVLLSAIAVNEKGMVSDPLVLVYKLEFQEDY